MSRYPFLLVTAGLVALTITGCATPPPVGVTSPYAPGPRVGRAVGYGVGTVAGNVAGAGVGVVEGAATGIAEPFDPTTRIVRQWHAETTPDGRTIQVPVDVLVDRNGRVVGPAPKH